MFLSNSLTDLKTRPSRQNSILTGVCSLTFFLFEAPKPLKTILNTNPHFFWDTLYNLQLGVEPLDGLLYQPHDLWA